MALLISLCCKFTINSPCPSQFSLPFLPCPYFLYHPPPQLSVPSFPKRTGGKRRNPRFNKGKRRYVFREKVWDRNQRTMEQNLTGPWTHWTTSTEIPSPSWEPTAGWAFKMHVPQKSSQLRGWWLERKKGRLLSRRETLTNYKGKKSRTG